MSKSNYLENKVNDHVLGGPDFTRPATVYAALFLDSDKPTDSNAGTECSGTDYARAPITNNATNFPASSGGVKSNGTDVDFAVPGAGGWGLVGGFALFDAPTGGNQLYWGNLTTPKTLDEGDDVSFPAGTLVFTED